MPEVVYFDTRSAGEIAADDLRAVARTALDDSDRTVLRCYEAGEPVPEAWAVYRDELRALVTTGEGEMPARPDWP